MRLAPGLAERGWESWLAGPEQASIYAAPGASEVPVTRLPFRAGYGHPLADARVLRGLGELMRRHRFDLVCVRSDKGGALGRLAARARGVPAVLSAEGWSFDPALRGGPGRLVSLGVARVFDRWTAEYVCVAESERRVALEHGVGRAASLHVVRNGTPGCNGTADLDPGLARFAGGEGPLAACVNVLRPAKGVDVFIQAAPRVLERLPAARLAVIGNGPLRASLERQARALELDGRLRFFDYRPPASRWLGSLDVLVLPSRHEALPIGLLEAMACGIPQVVTDVGGNAEAVEHGETGLLCPPDNPHELADGLVRLLGDPELRTKMATASRERHQRLFSLDRMLDGTAAVFDLVGSR